MAYASPQESNYGHQRPRFQSYNHLKGLLDKIADMQLQSMSDDSSNIIIQAIDQAAKESLSERARAEFWGSLLKGAASLLGK